jgi:hypothetical protein
VQEQLSRLAVLRDALAMDEAKHNELARSLTRFHEHRRTATTNLQSVVAGESWLGGAGGGGGGIRWTTGKIANVYVFTLLGAMSFFPPGFPATNTPSIVLLYKIAQADATALALQPYIEQEAARLAQ